MGALSIMTWNWQQKEWPNFRWDNEKLSAAEQAFTRGSGIITGSKQHLDEEELNLLHVELLSTEAIDTSEIEGEILNRESVQASIRYELGLSAHPKKATPQEFGIAEMMTDLYE
ncbi:MAG: DUF4172 domain-containing protein, partial [Coxiellaceae bacterium]|nr:DUF4172 domain-containing protein [Coxiellaceae bacterium]